MDKVKEFANVEKVKELTNMEKVKDKLAPEERKDDEDQLYGENVGGMEVPRHAEAPLRSPLAQGHIRAANASDDGGMTISAPIEVNGMTGQYIAGRDTSPVAEQERKKHGTAMGLASATMASGAVGGQCSIPDSPRTAFHPPS